MKLSAKLTAPLLVCGLLTSVRTIAGQSIVCGPRGADFAVIADSPSDIPFSQLLTINVIGADKVRFKLTAVNPTRNGPNFVVVSPSEGTAPTDVLIAANLNVIQYLPPGEYGLTLVFSTVDAPSSSDCLAVVQLTLFAPPPPAVTSVVSAASLQPAISPGEVVSIFGANIGTPPVSSQYDYTGLFPTTLGNTTVTFGGTPAPLLYVSTTQINAVVPFEVAGQKNVDVVVTHDSVAAPSVAVPIVDTSPAIFTTTQTGKGQGAIQNATGPEASTPNSVDNPAPQGSGIAIFATGGGLLTQTGVGLPTRVVQDGSIFLEFQTGLAPAAAVSLTIGGQPARILYAAAAPYEVLGMLQVNAVVPSNIGSGPQPVVLTVGKNNNASQQVTVAVQ
jgi:uncharacterized protein (TIGR03437 family)